MKHIYRNMPEYPDARHVIAERTHIINKAAAESKIIYVRFESNIEQRTISTAEGRTIHCSNRSERVIKHKIDEIVKIARELHDDETDVLIAYAHFLVHTQSYSNADLHL